MVHIFGKYFFPHVIKGEYETPEAHLDLINELSSPKHSGIIFPRGFAKSTWEKIDTLHDIVYNIEPVIVYISDSLQDAQFHFESIRSELENNEKLREVYGNLVPDLTGWVSRKWTNSHFETLNGVNCIAKGAGKGRGVNVKNQRPTKVIIDDGETDEGVRSKHRREKYHNWLTQVIFPSLDKQRGRLKVIGTVIHPEAEVKRFYDQYGGIFRRAIEGGKSIWPQMWPVQDLNRLRDGYVDSTGKKIAGIGLRAFSQEYLNEPINDETSIFKQAWLDEFTYDQMPTQDELDHHFEIKMAVDPNAGQSEMADFMAIVVIARDKRTNIRYVLYADHFKLPIKLKDESKPSQVKQIDTIYKRYNPLIMGVEKVLNQTALYQILLGESQYRLTALSPEGKDKVNRARYVEPLVSQGIILFNPRHTALYDELIAFPNGDHDDLVDAFVYCNSMFDTNTVKLNQTKSPMITGGLMSQKF